jgi:murein DD-endopeptidase MepM/ murein hydrolase activator NlpD
MHYGIDLSTTTAPQGGPVRSVTDMVITRAYDAYEGGNSTAGTYVKGHTPDGAYTFTYNHGADGTLQVAVGDTVTPGTVLFTEGATGNVTGTHLHFEIIEGNWPDPWAPPYNNGANFIDPLPVLREHGVNI